jgi:hypothetical protein
MRWLCDLRRSVQYWADCLKEYEGQFRDGDVRFYLHNLTAEMGEHLDLVTLKLSNFRVVG